MRSAQTPKRLPARWRRRLWAWAGGLGLFVGSALPAAAQSRWSPAGPCWPPPSCPAPVIAAPGLPAPVPAAMPVSGQPAAGPTTPSSPQTPQTPVTPPSTTPTPPAENLAQQAPEMNAPSPGGNTEASLALGGETFATGYIDPAIPVTQFRFRYDSAYGDNRPDRAEFFYAKCGCLADPMLLKNPKTAGLFDPSAPGPRLPESNIDFQDLTAYMEVAFGQRFSAFVEAPVRFLNPDNNENTAGFADMNAGFKYALLACQDHFLTFQFRTYIPTGDPGHGLGTDHVSLEPAALWHQHLTDRLVMDSELRDWIPIGGTDFAGNVLRYGVGLSYLVLDTPSFRVIPVTEFVGWTVLSGKESTLGGVKDAAGDEIVNAKVGVRFGFGSTEDQGFLSGSDLYVGYGRALTGAVWYKDILRVEYRMRF